MKKKKIKTKRSGIKSPDYSQRIIKILKKRQKKPLPYKTLIKELRDKGFDYFAFVKSVERLKKDMVIKESSEGFSLCESSRLKRATIVKLNKTFGFARLESGEDVFVSGRNLLGALPDDVVMLKVMAADGDSPEGKVMEIAEANCSLMTGTVVGDNFNLLIPDIMPQYEMIFKNPEGIKLHGGDKVLARVVKRGKRHCEHKCEIVSCFGSSQEASVCAESILTLNGIKSEFSPEVLKAAKRAENYGEITSEISSREDLRDLPIFTIDSAHTKDIDDAINVKKVRGGYELGVHIADVSHYVTAGSTLDKEAFERGTSVYYADRVVPMLPTELSNGICSLNGGEDRLAFSCLMKISSKGELKRYEFKKTVIRSRVKGVYSEINRLLAGERDSELEEKYREVAQELQIMKELSDILENKKRARGAPQIESGDASLLIDENGVCVGTAMRERGESELIIENMMLMANEAAARVAKGNKLPFVFRVHENPDPEKVESLKEVLNVLGIPCGFSGRPTAKDLSAVLERVRGKDSELIVNSLVLRSMAKAKYSTESIGHFGLALSDYAHFTSPIRRYPDLAIHRILTDFVSGMSAHEITRKYKKFVEAASKQSSDREILAMKTERSCDDCYKAEYMKTLIGDELCGTICSVMDFGFFVMLDNACEGLVRTGSLSEGEYSVANQMTLKNLNTGESYTVGERVTVTVENANVSSGKVDLGFVRKS